MGEGCVVGWQGGAEKSGRAQQQQLERARPSRRARTAAATAAACRPVQLVLFLSLFSWQASGMPLSDPLMPLSGRIITLGTVSFSASQPSASRSRAFLAPFPFSADPAGRPSRALAGQFIIDQFEHRNVQTGEVVEDHPPEQVRRKAWGTDGWAETGRSVDRD